MSCYPNIFVKHYSVINEATRYGSSGLWKKRPLSLARRRAGFRGGIQAHLPQLPRLKGPPVTWAMFCGVLGLSEHLGRAQEVGWGGEGQGRPSEEGMQDCFEIQDRTFEEKGLGKLFQV